MPRRPSQPCKSPGCRGTARPGKATCADCNTRTRRDLRARRGHSTEQGYGRGHRDRFRVGVLQRDRVCVICKKREATVADHYPLDRKTLVKMGLDADDPDHGRGVCKRCHDWWSSQERPGGWYRGAPG